MMESPKTTSKAERKCDPCRVAKQKCNPPERTWDENKQEKCTKCTKAGNPCGPNLTQFESNETSRGKKRKAKENLDHGSTLSNWRAGRNFGTPTPNSSSHDGPKLVELTPGMAISVAGRDDSTKLESTPRFEQYETPTDANSKLDMSNQLLWYYQYINHPKQTILFLEKDTLPQRDSVFCQKDVAIYLAWKIEDELDKVVQNVDVSQCSAEHVLLLVREAVHRFRRLANNEEALLEVEYKMLEKRVQVAQRNTMSKGKLRDTMSFGYKGSPFHQQTLEMERNELICNLERLRRSISPEAAGTPSSDRSAGSKRAMKQVGGLLYSRETANLLEDSPRTHVSNHISSKSFVKNRRLRGKGETDFPALHRALLFGTDQEAVSWARQLESNEENIELVDFYKRKVAHVAAEVGRVHLLNIVLSGHRKSLDTLDAFGLTPLIIAVLHGHLACCKLLINAGFDQTARVSSGRNLLSIACRRGHLRIVEYLINELGFPPYDDSGRYICSPIHDAIESGNFQICALLINSGADVYQPFNGKTPSELAQEKGLAFILQLISGRITRTNSIQPDPVSAHLGYQHGLNLQYNPGDYIDHQISQQHFPNSQMHDAASHSPSVPPHLLTANTTPYTDPR